MYCIATIIVVFIICATNIINTYINKKTDEYKSKLKKREEFMSKIASVGSGEKLVKYKFERTLDNREQWEKLCEIIAPYLAEKFPINELDEEMTR